MGTGIDDAFRDVEYLGEALDDVFAGKRSEEDALGEYQQKRDASQEGKYELICEMARLEFTPEFLAKFAANSAQQAAAAVARHQEAAPA